MLKKKTNDITSKQAKNDSYHHKLTKNNMITIVLCAIALILVLAVGIWRYSRSNNKFAMPSHSKSSKLLSPNQYKTIPNRLSGTYMCNIETNKYYHVNILWHVQPKHLYQQLIILRNKPHSANSQLKNAQQSWKIKKQNNKSKKYQQKLIVKIKHATNKKQQKSLQLQLKRFKQNHNSNNPDNMNRATAVRPKRLNKTRNKHQKNNKDRVQASLNSNKAKMSSSNQIPVAVQSQMKHLYNIAENYNTAYNVKNVSFKDNHMLLNLYVITRVADKFNNQLSHFINIKYMNSLTPKVGTNNIKLVGNNLIYKGRTFYFVPQKDANHLMHNDNFTNYWAGY